MPALSPADYYHTGIVVADLDQAAERLSAAGGYRWTKPMEYTIAVTTADGPMEIPFRLVYSIDATHIELIQQVPGSVWVSAPRNAVHHLGYWCDDVDAVGRRLQHCGYTLEVRPDGDLGMAFAYYLDPLGVRIELVNRAMFGDWAAFLEAMTP